SVLVGLTLPTWAQPQEGSPGSVSLSASFPNGPLDFGIQAIGSSMVLSYELQLTGSNFGGDDLVISTTYPFTLSLSPSGIFRDTVILTGSAASIQNSLYVKMNGTLAGSYSGIIKHQMQGASNVNVPVTGVLSTDTD